VRNWENEKIRPFCVKCGLVEVEEDLGEGGILERENRRMNICPIIFV
jgi:hypothetical protein